MRRPKFGNIHVTIDGHVFPSKREAARYQELRLMEKAGEIHGLELQKPYRIDIGGRLICRYLADFAYTDRRGIVHVEDAKGYRTPEYRLKKKLVRAVHGIEIEEV